MLQMKKIKKVVAHDQLRVSTHSQYQMQKRGYNKHDITNCLWKGEITEMQYHRFQHKAVIEGLDVDGNPIVCVIGLTKQKVYILVTVFPPIKEKFKRVI